MQTQRLIVTNHRTTIVGRASWGLPGILFTAVLVPIAIFVLCFVNYHWSNALAIRRLEAKARKNGEPLSLAELEAFYAPISAEQNGAVLMMAAWEKKDPSLWQLSTDHTERCLPGLASSTIPDIPNLAWQSAFQRTNDIDAHSLLAAETYLREQKEHLDEIRAALRYPQFQFPVKITDRGDLPHLVRIKNEALNFSIEAMVAGERGDVDSAIAAIESTANMGKVLASEPVAFSQFVRLSCYSIALNDMERLLSRHSLSTAQLDRLATLLENLRASGGLRLAVLEARCQNLKSFSALERTPGLKLIGKVEAEKRNALDVCDRILSVGDADNPEVLQEYEMIWTNAISSDPTFETLFLELPNVAHKFAAYETRRRAAVTVLAVEHYRLQHQGRLPQQLVEITPQCLKEIPADPFDGKALRFKRLACGFVVYSAGVNRDGSACRDEAFFVER